MKTQNNNTIVRWEKLLPEEFSIRQKQKPLVYLPLGICEPHGHIAPFGLDTLKANFICDESARRYGGIVAPTLGYQIHESGFHAQWLEEVVGEVNPKMTSMPPDVILRFFLYQLRAFTNAGFKSIFAITGHAGGNQEDFRLVADCFMKHTNVKVIVKADPELVDGKFEGDHAGKYEISQLLYLYPELMALDRLERTNVDRLGQFAQGADASEATTELGQKVIETILGEIGKIIEEEFPSNIQKKQKNLDFSQTETIWQEVLKRKNEWITLSPRENQKPVSKKSQWSPYEYL